MLHVVVTLSRHEASEVKWSSFDIVSPQGQDIIFFFLVARFRLAYSLWKERAAFPSHFGFAYEILKDSGEPRFFLWCW